MRAACAERTDGNSSRYPFPSTTISFRSTEDVHGSEADILPVEEREFLSVYLSSLKRSDIPDPSTKEPANDSRQKQTQVGESRPLKVLIIDDEMIIRESLRSTLEFLGVEADTVSSGEEGLQKLRDSETQYDLVLLDLVLHTGAYGVEIYREIRSENQGVQIMFMTASASEEFIYKSAEDLGEEILIKPLSFEKIRSLIDSAKKSADS